MPVQLSCITQVCICQVGRELELVLVCLLHSIYSLSFLVPLKIKPKASYMQGKGRSHVVLDLLILLLPPKCWQKLIKPAVWRLRQESIKFEVNLSYQVIHCFKAKMTGNSDTFNLSMEEAEASGSLRSTSFIVSSRQVRDTQ